MSAFPSHSTGSIRPTKKTAPLRRCRSVFLFSMLFFIHFTNPDFHWLFPLLPGTGDILNQLFGFSPISFAIRISSSFNRHFFFASAQSSGLYAILHLPFFLKVRPFILPLKSPVLTPYVICQDSSDRHLHGSNPRTGL